MRPVTTAAIRIFFCFFVKSFCQIVIVKNVISGVTYSASAAGYGKNDVALFSGIK